MSIMYHQMDNNIVLRYKLGLRVYSSVENNKENKIILS